jgi:pimeloyl-ACP methyl ester carboxylesterase
MAPVARALAGSFRVLEPWQRGSSAEPLTVARHVQDLHELLAVRAGGERCALVGHSWGAMLALAFAAAHPNQTLAVVLIGCGTFTVASRARMHEILESRAELTLPLYSYDLGETNPDLGAYDAQAHRETWDDMIRLQAAGVYPAAFDAIRVPVIMLHGSADPHPGSMIRGSLEPFIPQLEYLEWDECGHYPWLERAVHAEFHRVLTEWLSRRH